MKEALFTLADIPRTVSVPKASEATVLGLVAVGPPRPELDQFRSTSAFNSLRLQRVNSENTNGMVWLTLKMIQNTLMRGR